MGKHPNRLTEIEGFTVDELLLAPLFPHHARTESSLKHAKAMDWNPSILELPHFPSDPAFIEPLAESIQPHLTDGAHLLFSYHGLPISQENCRF